MSPPEYENFYKYKLIVPTVHVIVVLVFGIKAYFKSNHILDKIEAGKIKKTTFNYSK